MTIFGLRELKARPGKYVSRASGGEAVIVTDRGLPVAILAPVPAEIRALDEMQRHGRIGWSGGKPEQIAFKRRPRGPKPPNIAALVVESRKR